MKMITPALSGIALMLALAGTAPAAPHCGNMGDGCGDCGRSGALTEQQRTFQLNTIDLRQDMMMKRFEVQRENLKATPDNAKIETLRSGIKALQARIHAIKLQSGIPDDGKHDGECFNKGIRMRGCDCGQAGGCNGK